MHTGSSVTSLFASIPLITIASLLSIVPTVQALNSNSIELNGVSQLLEITDGNQTNLNFTDALTLEMWIKLDTPLVEVIVPLFMKREGINNQRSYSWYLHNTGGITTMNFDYSSTGSDGTDEKVSWTPSAGVWYHIAVTKSGSDVKFYVDGIQQGTTQIGSIANIYDSTSPVQIGGWFNEGSPVGWINGHIDDIRAWNVVRTEAEIAANMNTELTGNETGLVGYWKFNGGSLEDATANNNDLTNVNNATFSTDTPFAGEQEINPVIIIPGILGSAQQHTEWVVDPILHTYDDLLATLDENGYTPEVDLFTFAYDWRNSNVATAQLLKERINEVKEVCDCTKVDVVAHSMGGLVARQYIQSVFYEDDVDQLIFLGTPHRGAPKAYLMWEGGASVTPSVFDRLMEHFLRGDARKKGFSSIFEYLHEHPVAAVSELLPDSAYLFDAGALRTYPVGYPANPFLESLNAGIQALFDSGSELYSFVSNDFNSIVGLDVIAAPAKAPLWEHGYPEDFDDTDTDRGLIMGVGDQTVPFASASFVNENLAMVSAKHGALPEGAAAEIVEILRGTPATSVVDEWNVPDVKVLILQMFSPANMLLTDPNGKKIGTTDTGDVNEIVGAFYAGPESEREIITIPNPIPGIYSIEVHGVGSGAYTLESSYLTDEKEDSVSRSGTATPGRSIEYQLNLAGSAADMLRVAATVESTLADLEYAYVLQHVDTGAYHSLKAKLNSVKLLKGKNVAARRAILENIRKELDRRLGTSVKREAYDILIEDILSML